MVSFSLPLIVCSYCFSCLIKDSIVSSCSHNFSFPHFSITCHLFSCVSILRVLANSYQNVVSIISILHLFCRHKHNLYRVNKKRRHNCNILRKMRAPVVRGKRKTSQFLRKHCCFLDWSSLGGRHVKLFIFHLDLESIWKIKLDIGAIWVEKEGLSCTLGSALLVCKTFSSLGPKTPYVLMDIGTLWTPSTLVCVASLGWKIAFFLGA